VVCISTRIRCPFPSTRHGGMWDQGVVWGITMDVFPMEPGEEIVWWRPAAGWAPIMATLSQVTWPIPVGPLSGRKWILHTQFGLWSGVGEPRENRWVYNNIKRSYISLNAGQE
jgi:hypothetical protein